MAVVLYYNSSPLIMLVLGFPGCEWMWCLAANLTY